MHQIILEHIKVPYLNKDRQLRIYLPPNYKDEENFPVIYMHDGQNLFDESTSSYGVIWDVATHLNNIYKKFAAGFICVGIDNDPKGFNRLDEYSPWVNTSLQTSQQLGGITGPVGGLGKQYLEFITECVKPHIDQNYKSNPSNETTAIMGSSMGGLISLYAGLMYSHVFSMIGAFSTSTWFAEADLLALIQHENINLKTKWYLDVGTHEASKNKNDPLNQMYIEGTKNVFHALSQYVRPTHMKVVVEETGIHHESAWSRRFEKAVEFLAGKTDDH